MDLGGFFRSHTDRPQDSVTSPPNDASQALIGSVRENGLGPSRSQAFALIHTGESRESPRMLKLPRVSDADLRHWDGTGARLTVCDGLGGPSDSSFLEGKGEKMGRDCQPSV